MFDFGDAREASNLRWPTSDGGRANDTGNLSPARSGNGLSNKEVGRSLHTPRAHKNPREDADNPNQCEMMKAEDPGNTEPNR